MNKVVKTIRNSISKYKITFENICFEWLENKRKNVKNSTYYTYMYNIKKYLFPIFGKFSLKKLEKYDFNKTIEELSDILSPKKTNDILCNLKSILNYMNERYDCKIDVQKIKYLKISKEPLTILSDKEIKKIEKYCLKENTLKSLGIIVVLNTGLRIGEICALKWENIDLERRELYIKNTVQRIYDFDKKNKKSKVIVGSAKTQTSVRKIPISNKLYNILFPLKKEYGKEDFFLTGKTKGTEPIAYRESFKKCLKENKINLSYKFHILRHTFATKCIEVGMDIKSLSEILGHTDVKITLNRYVHSSYKNKKKYLEKL